MSIEDIGAELVIGSAATWQPTDYDIRSQALELAVKLSSIYSVDVVSTAQTFYKFLNPIKRDVEFEDGASFRVTRTS